MDIDFESDLSIDFQSDLYFMGQALREAGRAYEVGEVPIGAVIVREGQVIGRAWNQVETLKDATAHAEMLALTSAQAAYGDWRLEGCTLYVTKEPCPMCAGAIVHCRPQSPLRNYDGRDGGGVCGNAEKLLPRSPREKEKGSEIPSLKLKTVFTVFNDLRASGGCASLSMAG